MAANADAAVVAQHVQDPLASAVVAQQVQAPPVSVAGNGHAVVVQQVQAPSASAAGDANDANVVVAQQAQDGDLTPERVKAAAQDLLAAGSAGNQSLKKFTKLLASNLGVPRTQVDVHREVVKACVKDFWATSAPKMTPTQRVAALVEGLGGVAENSKQRIHLVTVARVLPDTLDATDLVDVTAMTRQQKPVL